MARAALEYAATQRYRAVEELGGNPAVRLAATDNLVDALRDSWLVVEAVPEKLGLKQAIFADLAIKRESLLVVAEGVAEPRDVDALFADVFKSETTPFRFMDEVGLDVVLDIENHYCELAGVENKSAPMLQEYIAKGWLGVKSGRGFYNDYA